MSRLNLIVESLLRDIIEAQHAANCHAAGLARQYGKHGGVRGFQLPSAQIGSLEFDLKYAVTGTSGGRRSRCWMRSSAACSSRNWRSACLRTPSVPL